MKKISLTIASIALFALCSCSGQGGTEMLSEGSNEFGNSSVNQEAATNLRDTSGFVHFDDETVD